MVISHLPHHQARRSMRLSSSSSGTNSGSSSSGPSPQAAQSLVEHRGGRASVRKMAPKKIAVIQVRHCPEETQRMHWRKAAAAAAASSIPACPTPPKHDETQQGIFVPNFAVSAKRDLIIAALLLAHRLVFEDTIYMPCKL